MSSGRRLGNVGEDFSTSAHWALWHPLFSGCHVSRHWWHPVGPSGVTLESQWIIQTESPHLFKLKAYVSPLIESSSHKNVYFIKLNDKKWLSYVMIRWYIRFSCNLFWFIKNKQFKYVLLYIIFLLKNLMCLFKMQLYIIRIYVIYLFIK